MKSISLPQEVMHLLTDGAHLLVNVSGGADSDAMLTQLWRLYQQNHPHAWPGSFTTIHSHLQRNEWPFTLPHIQRYVTELTGQPPVIVKREKGDLLDRWWQRYHTLQAEGRDVPPWSSAAARFCTGEMKAQVIHRWTRKHFPRNATVISAIGIRADESPARARKSVFHPETKASAPTKNRHVYRWLPIHDFTLADVWATLGWTLERLEALRTEVRTQIQPGDFEALQTVLDRWGYTANSVYALNNDRCSCRLCVLASRNDLLNGIRWNPDHFRDLVELELASGFGFQQGRWLADLCPELLTDDQRSRLVHVKAARASVGPPAKVLRGPQQLRLL